MEYRRLTAADVDAYYACRSYESRGFVAWGREPRAMSADGRYHDELHMALLLT